MSWKKERKAEALLRGVAEKVGLTNEELYKKAGNTHRRKIRFIRRLRKSSQRRTRITHKNRRARKHRQSLHRSS